MSTLRPVRTLMWLPVTAVLPVWAPIAWAQPKTDVLTQHNDEARAGVNLKEAALTPASLRTGKFHKLYFWFLDGNAYAQPLYVSQITVEGKARDMMYVATEDNSVYAKDTVEPPVWREVGTRAGGELAASDSF